MSPLNGSIRGPNYKGDKSPLITPERLKQKTKRQKLLRGKHPSAKTSGFPAKDFGNDGKGGCLIKDFRHDEKEKSSERASG